MISKSLDSLRDVLLFRGLRTDELHLVASACTEKSYTSGRTVFEENSVGDSMYVILSGAVKIHKQDFYGGSEVITTLHEGDHFGELSLFDDAPRSAAVTTIKDSVLLELKGKDLRAVMSTNSHLAETIYRSVIGELANRLRETNEHLIYLSSGRQEE